MDNIDLLAKKNEELQDRNDELQERIDELEADIAKLPTEEETPTYSVKRRTSVAT